MKKTLIAMLTLMAMLGVSFAQDIPGVITGAATTEFVSVNNLGRAYEIGAIAVSSRDVAVTNVLTVALVNTQDTDLTGTNATPDAVTYALKTSEAYTTTYTWLPTTETVRVPAGASVKLTFSGGGTNDVMIVRKEKQ